MLSQLKAQLSLLWTIILVEVRFDLRLVRTWVFILGAIFIGLTNAIQQYGIFTELSLFSSSVFMYSPLFIPMTIYPDFQVLTTLGLVFLAFDLASRDQQDRLDEVVGVLPISNAQIVFGRAIGIVFILATSLFAFSILHYVIVSLLDSLVPTLNIQAPQTVSVISTWIVDAIPYLMFWTAIVMLVTMIVRYRVIAAAIVIGLMLTMYWLQNNASMDVLHFIGAYSLNTQLPSELAPVFTTESIVLQRVALLTLACAFLFWVAIFYPRLNHTRPLSSMAVAVLITVTSGLGFGLVYNQFNEQTTQFQRWLQVHEDFASSPQIDLESMQGSVDIHPNDFIVIDLQLVMRTLDALSPEEQLIFSLNPSYEIVNLRLDDTPASFSFYDGLLLIQTATSFLPDERLVVSVRAVGNPDPNFAYLDAELSPMKNQAVGSYGLILLGTSNFINHPSYVAMMPAVAWYPLPGSHIERGQISLRPRDYFNVELLVTKPPSWHLGGPGKLHRYDRENQHIVVLKPKQAIHEVGLFTAPFERRVFVQGDIEFELLVGAHAERALGVLSPGLPILAERITEFRERLDQLGFQFPFKTFTIVHSPSYLRTYGGGWEMPATSSLPGVFLLREGTLFEANFATFITNIRDDSELTKTEKQSRVATAVLNYFNNDITGGNVLDSVCQNVISFRTNPQGTNAERLRTLVDYLVEQLVVGHSNFYSIYTLDELSNLASAIYYTSDISNNRTSQTLNQLNYDDWVNRPDVHELMLGRAESPPTPIRPDQRLHANELFARTMGDLLFAWFGEEQIAELLRTLVKRHEGHSYSFGDFEETAESLGMSISDLFGDWLHEVTPAGFLAGSATTDRLLDTPEGMSVYEFSFPIRNDETGAGVFVVEYQLTTAQEERTARWNNTEPIKLLGNTAVDVSIHTSNPIIAARVQPFFSLNRDWFSIEHKLPAEIPMVQATPKPLVQPSNWTWQYDDVILVDDLDPGFSVDAPPPARQPLFEIQMIAFGAADPELISYDAGLPSYAGNTTMGSQNWSRQEIASSFGKYRRTLVRAGQNDSTQKVHFTAKLPNAGSWTLHYYLPEYGSLRETHTERSGNSTLSLGGSQSWGDFDVSVVQEGMNFPIHFDSSQMKTGWNALKTLDLQSGTTQVSVSSQFSSTPVVADAIFWQRKSL